MTNTHCKSYTDSEVMMFKLLNAKCGAESWLILPEALVKNLEQQKISVPLGNLIVYRNKLIRCERCVNYLGLYPTYEEAMKRG